MSERINLGEYIRDCQGKIEVVENMEFNVDQVSLSGVVNFKNCKFYYSSKSYIQFSKSVLDNVEIVGIDDCNSYLPPLSTNDGKIIFSSGCKIKILKLYGGFREVNISGVVDGLMDQSISRYYQIVSATIRNSNIEGKCERLYLEQARFTGNKKDIWNKEITLGAKCIDTVFDRVSLNPYYLSTKCADKSTLDLSGANFIDDWSKLRKRYSGLSLFIVLLLTVAFFLPFVFKTTGLLLAAKLFEHSHLSFEIVPLWQMLFFGSSKIEWGNWYFYVTVILILYNTIRLLLTISLAKLREEEQFLSDAGFQTVTPHPEKYIWQKRADRVLSVVFWLVLAISLYKVYEAFSVKVPIF